jgi:hypothetical protein
VPEHHRLFDSQERKRAVEQLGLRRGGPPLPARAVAMAKPRTIERYHAVVCGQPLYQAAQHKVLQADYIPVQKDDRRARPALYIVKAHSVHRNKRTDRWVFFLGSMSSSSGPGSRSSQSG